LLAAGVLADSQLDSAAADELTSRSLEMHRQLEDKEGMATVLNALAIQVSRRGNYAQAQSYLEEALLLWKELGTGRVMLGLTNVASIAKRQGDYVTARTTYEVVLEAFRSLGDVRGIASALNGLGEVAMAEGDYAGARRHYQESLAQFRQIDDRWEIAGALRDLGHLSRKEGDYASACAAYREALAMFRALGHRRGIARVLENLACCAAPQGRPEQALKLAGAAATLREKLGRPPSAVERKELDESLREARKNLTPVDQTNAWNEGRSMNLDEILEYTLAAEQAR
jgi:tetratricopeptide (TPR) repeat protein